MKLRFTSEAEAQADESDLWWRRHRNAQGLFARELAATAATLIANPKIGAIYTILDGQPVRRVFMPKTRHHVYYTVDTRAGVVTVHAVWGGPRERGPTL